MLATHRFANLVHIGAVMSIGQRISEERVAQGMIKIRDLASRLSISEQALGKIEGEKTKYPRPETLAEIADALNVRFRWLMTGTGPKHQEQLTDPVQIAYQSTDPGRRLLVDVLLGLGDEGVLPKGVKGVLDSAIELCAPPDKSHRPAANKVGMG